MHVAVLGAGYAGLSTARRLADRLPVDAELTVVNDGPDHLVRHEVHRVIRRPSLAETITVPVADAVERATVRTEPVDSVDPETGVVQLADGSSLTYDYGVLAFGSDTAYYGIEGLREHAVPLNSVADADRIREATRTAVDRALAPSTTRSHATDTQPPDGTADGENATDGGTADEGRPRIVIGGAGLSGVQVAGEVATLVREEGARVPEDVGVTLIERESSVAPSFPANFQRAVRAELRDRGVELRTDETVERVTADRVETDRATLSTSAVVWTGGITGVAAVGADRPVVRADLRLTDRTFALGDAARVVDNHGEPVPASASAAIRQAPVAATNVARLVEAAGEPGDPRLDRYTFDVPGWLVSVGDGAVAQLGPTVLRGAAATAAKTTVGAGYLTGVGAVRNAIDLVESELGLAD